MSENEISELIKQIQAHPSPAQKLESVLQTMKSNLEPQGIWTPDLEERLRRAIKLSN